MRKKLGDTMSSAEKVRSEMARKEEHFKREAARREERMQSRVVNALRQETDEAKEATGAAAGGAAAVRAPLAAGAQATAVVAAAAAAAEDMGASSEELVRMTMRAENAERRVAALEEELTQMARKHGKEVAALKLKMAEKDAQLMGGFGSAANLALGELGPPRTPAADDPLLAGLVAEGGSRGGSRPGSRPGRKKTPPLAPLAVPEVPAQ